MKPACEPKPECLASSTVSWTAACGGNAVEPENLVEAEAQQILQARAFVRVRRGLAGDEPVERGLPADDAADEFVAQAAVGGRKPRGGQRDFQQILRKFAAGQAVAIKFAPQFVLDFGRSPLLMKTL